MKLTPNPAELNQPLPFMWHAIQGLLDKLERDMTTDSVAKPLYKVVSLVHLPS